MYSLISTPISIMVSCVFPISGFLSIAANPGGLILQGIGSRIRSILINLSMNWEQKIQKWSQRTRTELTVLSPDLPSPIEGMNVEIKYAKAGQIVYLAILLIGSPICLFGIKSWFAFIVLLVS